MVGFKVFDEKFWNYFTSLLKCKEWTTWKHFWGLEVINNMLPTVTIEEKAKFQLEVSENEVVIFPPSKFTDPLKSIHGPLIRDPWTTG